MLTPMRCRSSRLARAAVALATLAALAAAGSACGGGRPAAVVSTLTPSAAASAAATATPSPGTTAGGTAKPSGDTTVAPASTATPGSAGSVSASPAVITDAGIRADLLKRLGSSPTLVGLEIKVRVVHRVVYLFGTVKSKAEKAAAEHIAVTEPGIARVESLIEIVPGGGGY